MVAKLTKIKLFSKSFSKKATDIQKYKKLNVVIWVIYMEKIFFGIRQKESSLLGSTEAMNYKKSSINKTIYYIVSAIPTHSSS
jgi:hypothetical protein